MTFNVISPTNAYSVKTMSPEEFLDRAQANWPTSPESVFSNCSPDDTAEVRALESQIVEGEFLALCDIIRNCRNRYQFAKTYKVLWADFRNTLAQPGSPNVPEAKRHAIKSVFDRGIRYKLRQMADWFEIAFADASDRRQVAAGRFENAIDIYAGKEGIRTSGCAPAVLLCVVGSATLLCVFGLMS